jgi:hypothetical protein
MEQQKRQFDFNLRGFRVICSALLYPDGSLDSITVDHIIYGMIDWLYYLSDNQPSPIRLFRMKLLAEARKRAAELAHSALSHAYDAFEL